LDGVKAALLLAEFGFRIEEVEEIFLYISNGEGIFRYREWLIQ
jgi:hypothetical protein